MMPNMRIEQTRGRAVCLFTHDALDRQDRVHIGGTP